MINTKTKNQLAIQILFVTIAVLAAALIIFPVLWMLPACFKDKREIFELPNKFFPNHLSLNNFKKVFNNTNINFLSSMISTFSVAICAVVGSLFINMLAAYAFSRLDFPGKKLLFGLVMVSMFIPGITILLTSIMLVNKMNLIDTFWVLLLPGLASAYNIFFFRQFFFGLPTSLEEAAIIDGSSHWGIFFKIFIPLSITPIIIVGINVFMGYWNSYLWPTLTVPHNTDLKQVMQVLKTLNTSASGDYGVVISASIISLLVPATIFAVFQKYIVQGIAISGIK